MKPVITSFMFSDDTQQSINPGNNEGVLHIINPQNVLRPPFMPTTHSFSVSFGLIKMQSNTEHNLIFQLISPSGQIAFDSHAITIPINNAADDRLPEEANGVMFNMNFRNVALREEGEYKGIVIINNDQIAEFPLLVYAQEIS